MVQMLASYESNRPIHYYDDEFSEANECFKTEMAEIKAAGKGDIEHYPETEQSDLNKIYNIYLDPNTPTSLANRVQMNVRLYFCRRANENMDSMTIR